MTNTEREQTEQRIIERGTPEHLERFRQVHAEEDMSRNGEPVSAVDFRLYRTVLSESGVLEEDAKECTKKLKYRYRHSDEAGKRAVGEIVHSAVEGFAIRTGMELQPVPVTPGEVLVFSRR